MGDDVMTMVALVMLVSGVFGFWLGWSLRHEAKREPQIIARYNAAPNVTRDQVRAILGMTTPKDRERDDAGEPWDG